MEITKQAIAEIASIINEDPDNISALDPRWVKLMKEGVIVEVHVSRWRGKTSLSLDDIGVPTNGEQALYDSLLTLGTKNLMPLEDIKRLHSLENRARQAPLKHGIRTHYGAFIPAEAYPDFKNEIEEIRAEYEAARDDLCARYPVWTAQLVDQYAEAARVAFRRRHALRNLDHDYRHLPEDEFVDAFVERIKLEIPVAEAIRDSFSLDYDLSYIPLPSLLAEDAALAAQSEAVKARADAEIAAARAQSEAEELKARMTIRMHEDVLFKTRQDLDRLALGFVRDVAYEVRSIIFDATEAALKTTEKNGYIHARTVTQLQNVIARIERINVLEDADANRMIDVLREIVNAPANERSAEQVMDNLRAMSAVTRASLSRLADPNRIGLDAPSAPSVRSLESARQRLNLPSAAPALERSNTNRRLLAA